MTDDAAHIAELIGEVRKLEGTNSAIARTLNAVKGDVTALDQRLADNTTQLRRRTRNTLLLLVAVVFVLAVALVSGVYAARYFSCRNDVSARFFAAEHDKVAGQIRGIQDKSITEFTTASQHYLDTIDHIGTQC